MALSFINTSGNIISEDFCSQLLIETKADYVKSKSFGKDVKKIDEDIATSFELLRERWEEIRTKILEDQYDTTQLRDRWIKPFLGMLGFEPVYISHNLKNDAGIEYHIPYRGWDAEDAPLIHMVHSSADFDARDKNNRTHPNKSPHDLLQQYLNTSAHSWAILINGRKVRILRDFYHSITKGFIEFDIEGIFETANTEQFRILYRMMHSSRFIGQFEKQRDEEKQQPCLLEKFHTLSRETGVRVGNNLRKQVRIAIETLGNGFAENLNPDDFDDEKVKKFYSEILNIIYRLLFLLFAEQKGWLPVKNDIYARTYSINALRERAERADYLHDNNEDLWEGLKVTFRLVTKGYTFPNGDTINAFGGQLFSDERIFHIKSPLKNKHLLKAIDALCFFTEKKLKNKINYATLAIDELGSVYESLLDYEPRLLKENAEINGRICKRGEFVLDGRSTERKTTGSYYTDSRLVAQLIDSALVPVIENALKDKATDEEKREALLALKVADIACGSGAFLVAALEKMGEYLSLIGKEEGEKPTEQELRHAKREVLQNCIYGVDLNPMALELAKFSLWITASMPNFPLSFLDHKLKCGNSLVGATPDLIEKGIPVEAFNPVTLDDKKVCSDLKKRVRKELEGLSRKDKGIQTGLEFKVTITDSEEEDEQYLHILDSEQEDAEEVENVAHEYEEVYKAKRENTDWKLADTWTAAFFIRKDDLNKIYPTNITLQNIKQGNAIDEDLEMEILHLARKYRFFHWHLEFPEVFEKGGFDCILGNPPWEKINLEDKEFFASRAPQISTIAKSNVRNKAILKLKETNPQLYKTYLTAFDETNKALNFYKTSNYYKYGNRGLLNTYPLFTELVINVTNKKGGVGYLIPSGFFNDDTISPLFRYASQNNFINNILDFENTKRLFPSVHRQYRFSVVTFLKNNNQAGFHSKFFLREISECFDKSKNLLYRYEDLKAFNPNNFVCPSFKNQYELDINRKLYSYGVLKDESDESNTTHVHRMINMSSDSALLKLVRDKDDLPVYESKLFHQFDHRYANFDEADEAAINSGNTTTTDISKKQDVDYSITPRYFASEAVADFKNEKWGWQHDWYFAYRVISSSTNERTSIASIIPKSIVSYSAYLIFMDSIDEIVMHIANMNTFVYDFAVRAKVNMNFPPVILQQSPKISVNNISRELFQEIKNRVISLIYTSYDLQSFAEDVGYPGEPFTWNDNIRFTTQCELNSIFAHVYHIDKKELDYILESFSTVKRKDMEKYGAYRTKDTILKLFDEMDWVRDELRITNEKITNNEE